MQAAASPLDNERAGAFLQSLLNHPNSMDKFISDDDSKIAHRLDIIYPEAPCKPLIAWGLSEQIRDRLRQSGLDGQFTIEELDDRYSRLVLFPDDSTATQIWVFKEDKVVSSILYGVCNWKQFDSKHFRFFISDTTLFHTANVSALESFLVDITTRLGVSDADMERLSREKIYYCFCKNQDEIHKLTGHAARGMYVVSHEIIISTYSAHSHELAHLLINFKLKQPHLYTHPFFLEGFAVAVGGRGRKSPEILHQLGLSLYRAGWISLDDLLNAAEFSQLNESISYPSSAPYNRFLLDYLEISNYLMLYVRYGGDAQSVSQMRVKRPELPTEAEWRRYLAKQQHECAIGPRAIGFDTTYGPVAFQLLPDEMHFGFAVPEITMLFDSMPFVAYHSFLFEQLFKDRSYDGARFLIKASSKEVGVYDLYTNTLIAHYASGLYNSMQEIPTFDNRYVFHIDRLVFPDDIEDIQCRFIED